MDLFLVLFISGILILAFFFLKKYKDFFGMNNQNTLVKDDQLLLKKEEDLRSSISSLTEEIKQNEINNRNMDQKDIEDFWNKK